jgi:hypothetical protein
MEPLVSFSDHDGKNFSVPQAIQIDEKIRTDRDWLWRASWHRGVAYAVVYQPAGDSSILQLVKSRDGIHYSSVTELDVSGRPNETTLRFTADDQMIALARREGGNAHGYIGSSAPPYSSWQWQELPARLGGPDLLIFPDGKLLAGTREYPPNRKSAMILARVTKQGDFRKLLTLPSGGDCSYPGLLVQDSLLYVSYYSSHEDKTAIYLARLRLDRIEDWLSMEVTPAPLVLSDKDGVVRLGRADRNAEIRYTLDGNEPDQNNGLLYRDSIRVSRSRILQLRAWQAGKLASPAIAVVVGADIFQQAPKINADLSPALRFSYYEGEISGLSALGRLPVVMSGLSPQFSLASRKRDTNFAFSYEGYINITRDGQYTFYLLSNDGSQLYLNDQLFIDNDGQHGDLEISAPVSLKAGKHKIALKYFQTGADFNLKVFWQGPGFAKQEIPATVLYHDN